MANAEHIALLQQGAAVWKAWPDANIIRTNLSGADLSEVSLSDTDLTTKVPIVGE